MGDNRSGQVSGGGVGGNSVATVAAPAQQPQQVIYVQAPAPQPFFPEPLGQYPQMMQCPRCHHQVVSSVELINGTFTWIMLIFLLIVFFPLFWLPLVMDCAKDAIHRCPQCGHCFGQFNRINGGSGQRAVYYNQGQYV